MAQTPLGISDLEQTDNETSYSIGNLRRAYAFGDQVSALNIDQDALFRILSKFRKKPVDDSIFKVTASRPFTHKRYAYVVGYKTWTGTGSCPVTGFTTNSDDIVVTGITPQTAGTYVALKMGCDYKSSGNIQNIYGQSTGAITVGATGTTPIFFLAGQIIRVNTMSASAQTSVADFFTCQILDVQLSSTYAYIGCEIVRPLSSATNEHLCSYTDATTPISSTYAYAPGHGVGDTKLPLQALRSYVVGNSYAPGSGVPGTFNDQPYSTSVGFTQIIKHALSMDNTTRATRTKFVENEWARLWANKLLEHKWDIADAIYWSHLGTDTGDGAQTTQGLVDYVLTSSNTFTFTAGTTSVDSLLEDFTTLSDPRYNNLGKMIFCVPTLTWNHLHKLGGYALTNLKLGYQSTAAHYTWEFSNKKTIGGANLFEFATAFGPINVMRDIHLDGSQIKILGINMDYVFYRPLVANGLNRDTWIETNVQENGVDARTDQVITEFGVEITMPEAHAVWL